MAPKKRNEIQPPPDSNLMFSGMIVFLVDSGVQSRRLQIWKQRLAQKGAKIEEQLSKRITHIFAMNLDALKQKVDYRRLARFKGIILVYQWLEDSLRTGEKVTEDFYLLKEELVGVKVPCGSPKEVFGNANGECSESEVLQIHKKLRSSSPQNSKDSTGYNYEGSKDSSSTSFKTADTPDKNVSMLSSYNPPDLNKNIVDMFKKLVDIYRALGDDRRSFSYYKAIPVIEKLPFKIDSPDQIKQLPAIGKSLRDHIQEIVATGKLSKLEHFENDEKVKAISLFGEVWGVGPATSLKLYDKGHRTLEDLKNDSSLTISQKLGLQYFDDIKTRIPRHEVAEMEKMLQTSGREILPEVVIVCGGSYRRGKSSCGDIDIIITHPDGQSHKGFLAKFIKRLKEMNFLREDLIFSNHTEGSDLGVDTYFGLCTYPGQELQRRIDLKVFSKDIFAFGLIHWTGNDTLNRRLRIVAASKGCRLDDTGLFPATPSSAGNRGVRATASLHFDTEKEVFDFLGFPWLEPHDRNL